MSPPDAVLASLSHPVLGACDLVRIEGINWVVRTRADGREHRVPPGARGRFKRTYDAATPAGSKRDPRSDGLTPVARLSPATVLAVVEHPTYGVGDVVRVEIVDWIVRFRDRRNEMRWPASLRARLRVVEDRTDDGRFGGMRPTDMLAEVATPQKPASNPAEREASPTHTIPVERRTALRVIEALRIGLPPPDSTDALRVEFGHTARMIDDFLAGVRHEGGRALVVRGGYGHGKTFALRQAEDAAVAAGFAVLRTEIDAGEIRLNHPSHVYHDLLAHLRMPDAPSIGTAAVSYLIRKAVEWTDRGVGHSRRLVERRSHLVQLQCDPLTWLLSDPDVADKPPLIDLLSAAPGVDTAAARSLHVARGRPQDWPSFSATTQGDFASYLLCGLGRLCRAVGYHGLVVVLDEMERWQDLNWQQQTAAGNLLGGLIWGATAADAARTQAHEPDVLSHSRRGGGFPFTTPCRCHLGVLIAMTPRGPDGPENAWQRYGTVAVHDLPAPTDDGLRQFFAGVVGMFCTVRDRPAPTAGEARDLAGRAVARWRHAVEPTMRAGVAAVMDTLEEWAGP